MYKSYQGGEYIAGRQRGHPDRKRTPAQVHALEDNFSKLGLWWSEHPTINFNKDKHKKGGRKMYGLAYDGGEILAGRQRHAYDGGEILAGREKGRTPAQIRHSKILGEASHYAKTHDVSKKEAYAIVSKKY